MSGVLTDDERRTLAAVCDTIVPRLEPEDGDSASLFGLQASDVRLAEAVERAMTALSARQVRELRLFIRLLDSPLFMLVAAGRLSSFSAITDAKDREAAMLALATSALPPMRSGYQALKRLATFLFYSVADNEGNPTWPVMGYSVPHPAVGSSALTITRVASATTIEAEVCVIGSGAGGGVVAAQVAAAGRSVIVLEAGPADQASDFDQREIIGTQRLYLDQGTTSTRDLGVAILAGRCVGGGTSINWQTSLRLPDYIRDEWAERSGVRLFVDDEFTRAFETVSARLSVGTSESTRNGNNAPLERGCTDLGMSWTEIPRNAHGCDQQQCGFCVYGCRVGGKQSTANTYLVDAQRSGHTTIVAGCQAQQLVLERGGVTGVHALALDETTGQRFPVRVRARSVVVAAGGIESPALLLRSGITHSHLGRNLYLHPTTAVPGTYREPVRGWIGAPQTVLCEQFGRIRGNYGYRVETAPIHPGLIAMAHPWHGAREHRRRMQQAAHVSALIVLTRDRQSGRVRVDGEGRAVIDYRIGKLERGLLQHGQATAARIHWAAGAEEILTLHTRDHTFRRSSAHRARDIETYCQDIAALSVHANHCGVFSAHQMGTCRIGRDRRTAVCDENGAVFDIPGLYVADASLFPASSGVNPMLTVMAMAYVVGERLSHTH